jgi:hypothetical protein
LIVNKLSRGSKEAFLQQLDPATMEEINRKRIHTEILKTVYGKQRCGSGVSYRDSTFQIVPDPDSALKLA